MAIIRINHCDFEITQDAIASDESHLDEWQGSDVSRIHEPAWAHRYAYEAALIGNVLEENSFKTVLELGSGPGQLSHIIQQKFTNLEYHLVDKPHAKEYFDNSNFKGNFFVQDMSVDLDITNLYPKYDLIICNDFLEHLYAPAKIIKKCYQLMNDNSIFFISVPNWRMAHQFVYRGLWDYDNFLYMMYIHRFEPINVSPSPLQTPHYPKLNSEETMPDELLTSWNFYFQFKKRI